MKTAAYSVLALLGLVAIVWVLSANDLALSRVFAPRREAVRRQVFEQSKAYREGAAQELRGMQMQYVQADSAHRAALRDVILHRAAGYDEATMPADLRAFLHSLQPTY
jgi:hypothetical protein